MICNPGLGRLGDRGGQRARAKDRQPADPHEHLHFQVEPRPAGTLPVPPVKP